MWVKSKKLRKKFFVSKVNSLPPLFWNFFSTEDDLFPVRCLFLRKLNSKLEFAHRSVENKTKQNGGEYAKCEKSSNDRRWTSRKFYFESNRQSLPTNTNLYFLREMLKSTFHGARTLKRYLKSRDFNTKTLKSRSSRAKSTSAVAGFHKELLSRVTIASLGYFWGICSIVRFWISLWSCIFPVVSTIYENDRFKDKKWHKIKL